MGGKWNPQETAPRVNAQTVRLTWRQNPSGEWEWQAEDGKWHPQEYAPVLQAGKSSSDTTPTGAFLAIAAGAVMIIGSFLPWFTAHLGVVSINRNAFQLGNNYGFSMDGVIVLALGLVTIAIGISRLTRSEMPRWIQRSCIITGVICGVFALSDVSSITNLAHRVENSSSLVTAGVGYGLPVTVVGSAIAVIAGFILRTKRPRSTT